MRNIILAIVLVVIVGSIYYLDSKKVAPAEANQTAQNIETTNTQRDTSTKLKTFPQAKELADITGYINTPENFKLADIVGKKVIIVDFWTYSCINCQRTVPYLNAWYKKYKDYGLEIVGVHTPEFEFEKDINNVRQAVKKYNIDYPVVLDSNYGTWQAYKNRYWPRKYLVDIDGFIVLDHIGEGGYEETEQKIQDLLKERNVTLGLHQNIPTGLAQPENLIAVDTTKGLSPETYFGSERNEHLGNGKTGKSGESVFVAPTANEVKRDTFYLDGKWQVTGDFITNKSSQSKILYRYSAKNVYFVAGSSPENTITIYRDGVLVGSQKVSGNQTYQIISDPDYGEHTLEIRIEKPGLSAFTFTFG